jgi:multidrug efflux pump subunit AcrA (membrane-fusion protein)
MAVKDYFMSKKEKRNAEIEELKARLEALEAKNAESEDEAELKATGEEIDAIKAQIAEKQAEIAELEAQLAELDKPKDGEGSEGQRKMNFMKKEERKNMNIEERKAKAQKFFETRRMSIENEEVRSVLVSSGKLATPTEVDGINGNGFAKVSSIIDLVKVVNCEGMGSNKVAYELTDAVADAQTEGGSAKSSDPTFDFVTIVPTSVAVLSSISKQAKKQSPLQYEAKVKESAMIALRQKASAIVTNAVLNSALTKTEPVTKLDEKAIRSMVLGYGGDEGVEGEAYLFLNKADLIALGEVRGTNEKKAVFEIIPDANPNTGIIKDGGLVVKYCLNKNLTAGTMLYGQPKNIELDLFSNYEIAVSEDFYFDKLMDAIRGDVELGADVIAQHGMIKFTVGA